MAAASPWIAIVDDDASVLKALERSLRVRAFRTTTHKSAADFLASLSEGLPECLIIDQQMPEMTGLELHQHLMRRGIQIPTIMISAHSDARLRERSQAAGVATLLSKPLQNATLFAAINAALQN
jgi:FixJ family two-component response regulator